VRKSFSSSSATPGTNRMPETGSGTFDFEHSGRVTIFCGSWDQDWLDGLPPP